MVRCGAEAGTRSRPLEVAVLCRNRLTYDALRDDRTRQQHPHGAENHDAVAAIATGRTAPPSRGRVSQSGRTRREHPAGPGDDFCLPRRPRPRGFMDRRRAGRRVTHPVTHEEIAAVNLLSAAGIRRVFTEMVTNFTGFAPLGTVLVAMIGIGVAERCGLFAALLKALVMAVPNWAITPTIIFAGIMSNTAADAGEDDGRCDRPVGHGHDQRLEQGGEQPAACSATPMPSWRQGACQRGEAGEVGDHLGEDAPNAGRISRLTAAISSWVTGVVTRTARRRSMKPRGRGRRGTKIVTGSGRMLPGAFETRLGETRPARQRRRCARLRWRLRHGFRLREGVARTVRSVRNGS